MEFDKKLIYLAREAIVVPKEDCGICYIPKPSGARILIPLEEYTRYFRTVIAETDENHPHEVRVKEYLQCKDISCLITHAQKIYTREGIGFPSFTGVIPSGGQEGEPVRALGARIQEYYKKSWQKAERGGFMGNPLPHWAIFLRGLNLQFKPVGELR